MVFKMKHAAVALAILASAGAQAATYTAGTLTGTAVGGILDVQGTFTDVINFSVLGPFNNVGGNVANLPIKFAGVAYFDITNLSVTLSNSAGADFSSLIQASGDQAYTLSGFLADGDYSLNVMGKGTGFGGEGKYTYALVAAPVPEPETYALLLAGLGLIAGVARRRV